MDDLIRDGQGLLGKRADEGIDRRDFMKVTLGAGFAAAALPVAAQSVIHTDSAGLTADTIHIVVDGQDVPVYRAQPEGKTNLPVILVASEIFGVHAHIADVARRFARLGYMALAPQLFVRQGDAAAVTPISELMKTIVAKTPDRQVLGDLDACVAWAAQHGGDTGRLGITGFCWGGRIAWMYAAHNPRLKAAVAWYGRLVGEPNPMTPSNPIDIAPVLKVPVLGLYGGKDSGIPLESVDTMRAALAKAGNPSEFVVYPEAGHAFFSDYRPSYVEAAAKDGFARCLAWFRRYGVA